jgi:hypothetical protein
MKRKAVSLSSSMERALNMYALSACAAGVGILALVQPAEARIIYTKAHRVIGVDSNYKLDLNHDGKADFIIYHNAHVSDSGHASSLSVSAASSALKNEAEGTVGSRAFLASALERGARIPKNRFSHRALMASACTAIFCTKYSSGKWINVTNRYVGLKFRIDGQIHYGWARLTVRVKTVTITATLTGYAFETIAGKSIRAGQTKEADDSVDQNPGPASLTTPIPKTPQPASLGALAMGAIWRRKERAGQGN